MQLFLKIKLSATNNGLQLCHLFKYSELTEVVRQNYQLFIKFLNEVQVVTL